MTPCYEGLKEIRVDVDERWRKTVRFSVRLWLFIWTVILLDPLLFLLDRSSCVFLGWGVVGVGVVGVGGVWIHLLLLLHIYTLPIIWLHWLLSRPCLTMFMNWLLSRPCLTLFMNWLLSRPCLTLFMNWLLSKPLFVVGVGGDRGG